MPVDKHIPVRSEYGDLYREGRLAVSSKQLLFYLLIELERLANGVERIRKDGIRVSKRPDGAGLG